MEFISADSKRETELQLKTIADIELSRNLERFGNNVEAAIEYIEQELNEIRREFGPQGKLITILDTTEIYLAFAWLNGRFVPLGDVSLFRLNTLPRALAVALLKVFLKCCNKRKLRPTFIMDVDQLSSIPDPGVFLTDLLTSRLASDGTLRTEMMHIAAEYSFIYPLTEEKLVRLKKLANETIYTPRNARKMAKTVGHPNQRTKYVEDPDPDVGVRPELGFRDLPDELKKEIAKMAGK